MSLQVALPLPLTGGIEGLVTPTPFGLSLSKPSPFSCHPWEGRQGKPPSAACLRQPKGASTGSGRTERAHRPHVPCPLPARSALELGQDPLELHGVRHVALDPELALHEGGHA